MTIVRGATLLALVLLSLGGSLAGVAPPRAHAADQPNIILVLADDMRVDDLTAMSYTQDALIGAGTTFSNAFVTIPICCPSRVSTLRGQYAHNHGIWANKPLFLGEPSSFPKFFADGEEESTIATWLQAGGYRTALIGKYLNNYPEGTIPGYVPPGWDVWVAQSRGRYYGFDLVENGKLVRYPKKNGAYTTDVYAEKAVEFVTTAAESGQPFFLYLAPHAPHFDYLPAKRHADAFPGETAPQGPSFNEADVSDKPRRMQELPLLGAPEIHEIDTAYRARRQTLLAVDEMMAALDDALEAAGVSDNTYVVFTADNGYFLGEHRLPAGKGAPYDEAVRVPFVVRGPGIPAGKIDERLVGNADLAPTFADLAGSEPADFVDGRSLVPLLNGDETVPWRTMLLSEFAGADSSASEEGAADDEPADVEVEPALGFRLLATADLRYIEYDNGEIERYDIVNDPAEIDNLAAETPQPEMDKLSAALADLAGCAAASCRTAEDAALD